MARCRVSLSESALNDMADMLAWYTEQGAPKAGERLLRRVFERIEALASHPLMGREVPEFQQPFLRELIVPPFRVVYRHAPGTVRVVRLWRSERLLHLPGDQD